MPRRKIAARREVIPDPKYHSRIVGKFVSCLLIDGKKSVAERHLYRALEIIEERTQQEPVKVFQKALDNCKPSMEVRSRRVGGSTYQVPVDVRPERRRSLAIRWIITYASARTAEKTLAQKLANEILDAYNNRGGAIKKREDTHKMAEANKAFAHYRW